MTDKEELKDIRKLADAMYYAAQYLTTDASRLHKAMDEYHKFIIHEWREEPVSEDLEEEIDEYWKNAPTGTVYFPMWEHFQIIAHHFVEWGKKQAEIEIQTQSMAVTHGCPKEPVSEDLKTELNKYIKDHFTVDKEQLDRFGIEEKDYMYSMDKSDMLKMIRHFTNNYKVPTSDFLEEAAKLCVSDYFCITNEEDWDEHAVDALNIFKIAAKWQKEQMMAKAVDGKVGYWNLRGLSVNIESPRSVKEGDKVKMIIIKED